MNRPNDIVAVGSAIVDHLVMVDHRTLASTGLEPGTMTLIDAEEADRLHRAVSGRLVAGGSAANTAVGVSALGGGAVFVGRVGADDMGRVFTEDLRAAGVAFASPPTEERIGTGRCLVLVTPDGERTMRTYLGAAPLLGIDCVDEATVGGARYLYLEGYLWDSEHAMVAVDRALEVARRSGTRVALSLSDPGCVERHHDALRGLLEDGGVDVLFANQAEVLTLVGAASIDEAALAVSKWCDVAALTLGPAGSVVVGPEARVEVAAEPVEAVVDTTGAGDQYAAGFLVGLCRGWGLERCARLASVAAADVIEAVGARPSDRLGARLTAAGLT